jgi:hypothetical protein
MRLNEKRMPEQTERDERKKQKKKRKKSGGQTRSAVTTPPSLPTPAMRYDRDKHESKSRKEK